MKQLGYSLLFLMLVGSLFAVEGVEFAATPDQTTLYFRVFRQSDGYVWDVVGSNFEAFVDGQVTNYDIALTEQGTSGYYTGTLSGIDEAHITAVAYDNATPAITDEPIGFSDTIVWDGSAVQTAIGELQANQSNWLTATGFATPTNVTDGHAATDGLITAVDTVVDAIKAVTDLLPDGGALTSLATLAKQIWMIDWLEGDEYLDTTTTPWSVARTVKSGGDEIGRKYLYDKEDGGISDTNQGAAKQFEDPL